MNSNCRNVQISSAGFRHVQQSIKYTIGMHYMPKVEKEREKQKKIEKEAAQFKKAKTKLCIADGVIPIIIFASRALTTHRAARDCLVSFSICYFKIV